MALHGLANSTRAAAEAFIAAGTAANTMRSYRSVFAYWAVWLQLRYGGALDDGALPPEVVVQFIVDHLARPDGAGGWSQLLPAPLDTALVAAGVKGKLGALAFSTVSHRLAMMAKRHQLKAWDNPREAAAVKTLLREARKARARQGVARRGARKPRWCWNRCRRCLPPAPTACAGCAIALLTWSVGGRRRSELIGLQIENLRCLDADTWLYALGTTKTDTGGVRREKPVRGPAAQALNAWLAVAPARSGPLFRRLYKGGVGLSGNQVARIVKSRAAMAGLDGDWAAHTLRSGFVT